MPYYDPNTGRRLPTGPAPVQGGTDYIYPIRSRFPVTEEEARRR